VLAGILELKRFDGCKASIPPSKWNAQYQQQPTGEENAIIKREWWKKWEKKSVPNLTICHSEL
jgi:hypothetical protein